MLGLFSISMALEYDMLKVAIFTLAARSAAVVSISNMSSYIVYEVIEVD